MLSGQLPGTAPDRLITPSRRPQFGVGWEGQTSRFDPILGILPTGN
jgi:hypothetical protein